MNKFLIYLQIKVQKLNFHSRLGILFRYTTILQWIQCLICCWICSPILMNKPWPALNKFDGLNLKQWQVWMSHKNMVKFHFELISAEGKNKFVWDFLCTLFLLVINVKNMIKKSKYFYLLVGLLMMRLGLFKTNLWEKYAIYSYQNLNQVYLSH